MLPPHPNQSLCQHERAPLPDGEPNLLGGGQVYHERESGNSLDRKFSRIGSAENSLHIFC